MSRRIAFTYLFWGFLFQLFNFYIQGVNLFPDVFGFILSAAGLNRLREDDRHFNIAYVLCFPLMIASLPNVYRAVNGPGVVVSNGFLNVREIFGFAEWCLVFLFVFHVCKGIQRLADRSHQWNLAGETVVRWRMFVGLQVAAAVLWVAGVVAHVMAVVVLSVGLLIYDIVVAIAFMTLLWSCRSRL